MTEVLRSTRSLCPECFAEVPGSLVARGDEVVLEASCEAHGPWSTVVWAGEPSFASWCGDDPIPAARHTCTAVVEVTRGCDLGCPVCFAESPVGRRNGDPSQAELAARFLRLFSTEGEVNIQLSGGEPTTREDLPDIVASACSAGFSFVQLNTNGLRLGAEDGYAEALRAAGLSSVFLQFDGLSDETYRVLRGRPLLAEKLRAVDRCAEAGLAVVLVPTVMPGLNDRELGDLVRFAASWPGVVRGLHMQPISYFGRYPGKGPVGSRHLTLPEVLRMLEAQTGGAVRVEHFSPSCCEHVRCSFRARYWVRNEGVLEPLRTSPCCCGSEPSVRLTAEEVPRRAVAATSRQWGRGKRVGDEDTSAGWGTREDGLSRFLADAERILSISGMLFQDAWSIDMERVERCCVQVVTEPGERAPSGLVPFCLWNLTSASGERLYPR